MKTNTKWDSNEILIKDNFFDSETFKNINTDLVLCEQKNKFINRGAVKDNSVYQRIYFNVELSSEHFAVKYVTDLFKKRYNIKITNMLSYYFLSTKNNLPTPHTDVAKINCLIYLNGDQKMANGTGFYVKDEKNECSVLNSHVGFIENRALIFDGSVKEHATLQSFATGNPSKRYAMANFINYYD